MAPTGARQPAACPSFLQHSVSVLVRLEGRARPLTAQRECGGNEQRFCQMTKRAAAKWKNGYVCQQRHACAAYATIWQDRAAESRIPVRKQYLDAAMRQELLRKERSHVDNAPLTMVRWLRLLGFGKPASMVGSSSVHSTMSMQLINIRNQLRNRSVPPRPRDLWRPPPSK